MRRFGNSEQTTGTNLRGGRISSFQFGKSSVHVEDLLSFGTSTESDEYKLYEKEMLCLSGAADLQNPHGEIKVWVARTEMHPI